MKMIRCLAGLLLLFVPLISQAAEPEIGPWRLGVGAGAFAVTATLPGDSTRYKKILPGYQASISYDVLPETALGLFLPNLETGVLLIGGKRGYDRKGAAVVVLEMPILIQWFARVSVPIDQQWDAYGMLSLGVFNQKVWNSANVLVSNKRVAALGVGGGFSRKINSSYALDLGLFIPGLALSKGNKALSQRTVGLILNFRYAL